MMIKTGARALTPRAETPPAVISKTYVAPVATAPDPFDSPSYADMPAYVPAKRVLGELYTYKDLDQGTPEWFDARCGIVTASVVHQLIATRTLGAAGYDCPECGADAGDPCVSKVNGSPIKTLHSPRAAVATEANVKVIGAADNLTSLSLTATLVAERVTGNVEPMATSRDMERGTLDEPYARDEYSKRHAPATELGFMVREFDGFKIGYSPDGIVGDDGLIEIKSRKQRIQLATFLDDEVPAENMAQIQTGLLVSGREWLDYVSYTGGMSLYVKRVYPDQRWHDAIIAAVAQLEQKAAEMTSDYLTATDGNPPTERIDHYLELELKL